MKTLNGRIAVTPFESHSVQMEKSHGLVTIKSKVSLLAVKAVYSTVDGEYSAGDTIYVRGETVAHPFSKEVYEMDGHKFILLPKELVVGVLRL